MTFHYLVGKGFENVRRYAGGLQDWEEAGFPLEGDLVE
jgi:rhodanese-related sulfurtransferase